MPEPGFGVLVLTIVAVFPLTVLLKAAFTVLQFRLPPPLIVRVFVVESTQVILLLESWAVM